MHYQLDDPEQNQPNDELQISLNLRDPEEPEWLDQSSERMKKKKSQKIVPVQEEPVNFVLEELKEELERSKQKMTKNVLNKIKGKVQELQYGVFVGETTINKDEYLGALYKHTSPNAYIKQVSQKKTQEINDTVLQTHHQIQKQIHRDNLKLNNRAIPKSKQHLKNLENEDQYKLIQIKQGEIKHKIGSLKKQFENVSIKNKLKNMINSLQDEHLGKNYYSIEHPRTKQAEQFIRSIQASKMDHVNKMRAHAAMARQNDQDKRRRQQYLKEQQRQQRKTRLQEYYQSKLIRKMQEKQKEKAKRMEYQQWVKSFQREKPLELQREQQFKMKVIIPELEQRHKKLMTIRAQHRPIDQQQIAEHEEKYLQFKRDNDLRKRAQIELRREEQQQQQKQIDEKMFKGKYRYLVLEQMVEEKYPVSSKQIQQSKRDRIRAYNENVRSIHQDTMMVPDQKQKIQAETISNQKFVKRVRNMNGSMSVTKQAQNFQKQHSSQKGQRKQVQDRGHYKQGIQNLAFLRSIIRQQKEKQQDSPPVINLIEEKQIIKPKGYLQVQRQKVSNKKKLEAISKDIRKTAPAANSQIGAIKAKAEMVDENLRRKQLQLRNVEQGKFQGGKVMQQDYVNAIKAKIHMLNQFN